MNVRGLILVFCSLNAFANEEPRFPQDWGRISSAEAECPSIAGNYSILATTYTTRDGKEFDDYADYSNNSGSNFILFQRDELSYLEKLNSKSLSKDLIYVDQKSPEAISIVFYDDLFKKDFAKVNFTRNTKSLACQKGWWLLQRLTSSGGTEGYALDLSTTRLISRLENQDLIIHIITKSTRTDWFIFSKTITTDTFLKLRYMNSNGL